MATELIRDYLPDQAAAWDDLVARAVNGTMLHTRRYLSYHGDRFRDRSLLITNSRGWPIGALPAAEDPADASVVTSHPGLTYGGLVHDGSLRGESMMRVLSRDRGSLPGPRFRPAALQGPAADLPGRAGRGRRARAVPAGGQPVQL